MPTTRRPRPAEERAALEARRLQAAELFAQGRTQAEVAHALGVSRQSAHVWHARFTQGGVEALRSRGPTGPDPKLSDAQLAKVEQALLAGAMANGFATDLWTLERVAVVITQLTGIRYHPGHVWVILRRRLGWTLQRPERRASERDEEAIARWVAHEWPRIKKGAAAASAWIVFFDESAVSLIPPVRRTWSPRGQTPILRHRFGWKKASMAAALGYRPDGTAARLCFHLQQPSYDTRHPHPGARPARRLQRWQAGDAALGRAEFALEPQDARLSRQPARLAVGRAAPRLSPRAQPVRVPVGQPQRRRAGNLPTTTLVEVADAAHQGIQRVCKHEDLVIGFLAHTGLTLDP
jgi:transposase